jgi:rRNA maturation protein Nop10
MASPEAAVEGDACPSCGEVVEPIFRDLHRTGLDGDRPECGHQDLAAVAARLHPQPKFGSYSWA